MSEEKTTLGQPAPGWLIDPKQSRLGYWFVYAAGVLQLFGAGATVVNGQTLQEIGLAVILVSSALLFLAVARALGARKGGMALTDSGAMEMYGTGKSDRVSIPLARFPGILVSRREETWNSGDAAVLVWSVSLPTVDGASLFFLEPPTGDDANEMGLMLRQAVKLPIIAELPELEGNRPTPPPSLVEPCRDQERFKLRAGTGWASSVPALLLGQFSLLSGAVLLAGVKTTGVAGFLFGPVFCALGLCLLALWAVRAWGGDVLILDGPRLEHYTFFGPWSWGRRVVNLTDADFQARLRSRGYQGFLLELVCGGTILMVGAGATRGAQMGPDDLLALGNYLQHRFVEEKHKMEIEQ